MTPNQYCNAFPKQKVWYMLTCLFAARYIGENYAHWQTKAGFTEPSLCGLTKIKVRTRKDSQARKAQSASAELELQNHLFLEIHFLSLRR